MITHRKLASLIPLLASIWITPALADTRTVTISTAGASPTATGDNSVKSGDTVAITCPTGTRCGPLIVKTGANDLKPSGAIVGDTWTSATIGGAGDIVISWDAGGTQVAVKTLTLAKADTDGGTGGTGDDPPLGGPYVECPSDIGTNAILVDTQGNILASHLQKFSEEDTLVILITGYQSSFTGLTIKKTSAFRDVTTLHILGDVASVIPGKKQGGNNPVRCRKFELANFSSGRGAFSINNSTSKTSVEIEFAVRPRYNGMFTVAFIGSWLKRPSFSARDVDGVSQIAQNPGDSVDGRYALMYTGFLPLHSLSSNNFKVPEWNQRVGLSVGVILDDPADNILFGVNLGPINGISLVLGLHAGEVNKLDGVTAGTPWALDAAIPVEAEWKAGVFIGASLDISVATKLFFSLFSR